MKSCSKTPWKRYEKKLDCCLPVYLGLLQFPLWVSFFPSRTFFVCFFSSLSNLFCFVSQQSHTCVFFSPDFFFWFAWTDWALEPILEGPAFLTQKPFDQTASTDSPHRGKRENKRRTKHHTERRGKREIDRNRASTRSAKSNNCPQCTHRHKQQGQVRLSSRESMQHRFKLPST